MSKSQSLERGIDLLEAVNQAERPVGTRELARILNLSPPVVQRLINTLAERHYLKQDPDTKRYTVGYKPLIFGAALNRRDQLLSTARSELNEVSRKLRVDSFMATLQGDRAIYLISITGQAPVTVSFQAGDQIPLHSTAIGKCILASISDDRVREMIGTRPLPAITPKTITDPERLMDEVSLTRHRGYAVVQDENIEGITSVGAILSASTSDQPTAISLSFSPFFSKDVDIDESVAIITAAARRINKSII